MKCFEAKESPHKPDWCEARFPQWAYRFSGQRMYTRYNEQIYEINQDGTISVLKPYSVHYPEHFIFHRITRVEGVPIRLVRQGLAKYLMEALL